MCKIRIKNFGPIKDGYNENGGWLDILKTTVFIGDQGSGKSTVAKLVATFMWMEKALNRGDLEINHGADLIKLFEWQRLKNYFKRGKEYTEIEYIGNRFKISFPGESKTIIPKIEKLEGSEFIVPKIMYVPAERNFLSTVKGAFDVSGLPKALEAFAEEYKRAQIESWGKEIELPIPGTAYQYDKIDDVSYLTGDGYQIDVLEASSGFQSLIPLYIVSENLSNQLLREPEPANARLNANRSVRRDMEISEIMLDRSKTNDEKIAAANKVYAKYHAKCFVNIVEEPEQNLFPGSQRSILNSLIAFNNLSKGNKLILSTHSPYLLSYITLAIKCFYLLGKTENSKTRDALVKRISEITPQASTINPDELVVYELDKDGVIKKLGNYNGLPSDENYLNDSLAETNDLFAQLLDIEDLCS